MHFTSFKDKNLKILTLLVSLDCSPFLVYTISWNDFVVHLASLERITKLEVILLLWATTARNCQKL